MPKVYNISELHEARRARWYFGGVSSAAAACVTHPLDLLKVHLQTQQEENLGLFKIIAKVYREGGITPFYNGISASVLRQLTYTTARFAIYEMGKSYMNTDSFSSKLFLATIAGSLGGIVGVPSDLVNVRMQNDIKLPLDKRRNYKHILDGLLRVYNEEGIHRMFTGGATAVARGVLVTIGQIAVYDQVKSMLLLNPLFKDDVFTHLNASTIAACAATLITQPLDVIKTRAMNAKPNEYKNILDIVHQTARNGPLSFYKGFVPAFIRLGPQTVLMFLILEQMRIHFGYLPTN